MHIVFAMVPDEKPIAIFADEADALSYMDSKRDEALNLRVRTCVCLSDFLPYARLMLYADLAFPVAN